MADHIPFVTGSNACRLVTTHYSDSEYARIQLHRAPSLGSQLPKSIKLWLDAGVDGFDDLESRRSTGTRLNPWFELMKSVSGFEKIGNAEFQANPEPKIVKQFVLELLDRCVKHRPTWITVPQLPRVDDSSRNSMNRLLAKATGEWKSLRAFPGRFILPLIFTHQNQVNGKTQRNPQVKQTGRCYHESQADGFWAVDRTLDDESGSKTLQNTRVPAIVSLHQELNEEISSKIRIAGPYWGINLLLWAKGLVDFPAIGVGSAYHYSLTGGRTNVPATCLAISALRRRVKIARLVTWLDEALNTLGQTHPSYPDLARIRKQFSLLSPSDQAREQVSKFYKSWFDMLAATPRAGRPLALFQDLSAAFVLGKSLSEFEDAGPARRPESVVEPLMLNCL